MVNSEESLGITFVEPPESGITMRYGQPIAEMLVTRFGVRPGLRFYDDGEWLNALAISRAIAPEAPDGTVILGKNLWRKESLRRESRDLSLLAIIAHEFGHIVQFKRGMSPDGPWQMEPHADFMAGWFLAWFAPKWHVKFLNDKGETTFVVPTEEMVEAAIQAFFEIGDYGFNAPSHHGEPEFRAAMVRAGYESGSLDANEAFEKGKKFAGLN